ncbi:hypothetical protein M885DRAFT_503330, partial [Pelagophyceae sp. CCMP2097]
GRTAFAAFLDKSHAAGAADKMARDKRQVDVDRARSLNAPVPPPPPPLLRGPAVRARPSVLHFTEDTDHTAPDITPRARTNVFHLLESQMNREIAANCALRREIAELRGDDVFVEELPRRVCNGVPINLPNPIQAHYPHAVGDEVWVTWTPPGVDSRHRSNFCSGFVDGGGGAPAAGRLGALDVASCNECAKLVGNTKLAGLVARAWDEHLHLSSTKNCHLTSSQLQRRLCHRAQAWRELSLK